MTLTIGKAEKFQVLEDGAGQRLDEFLADRIPWASRMRIRSAIHDGNCTVDGATTHRGRRLRGGEEIAIALNDAAPSSMQPEYIHLTILHEDDDIIVVDKPSGMLVHPTLGVKSGTLCNALAFHFNSNQSPGGEPVRVIRPGLVHRLDRATSGLMVVTKNQRSLGILSRHFHHRLVSKRYLALVSGDVSEEPEAITAPIGRVEEGPPFWRVTESGRPAETRLRRLGTYNNKSLVELEPVTGRTNQLRIHCAYINRPIVGDAIYGGEEFERLCLHAVKLGFNHPSGGGWMEFQSPLPAEIARLLE
jgi:23S rRNA pseudouridine1911/1915/1917 synthase